MSEASVPRASVAPSATPAVRSHILDGSAQIVVDVPCLSCGYNLRGLNAGGACPECATATGNSLRPDFLIFSNPDWIRRVATGCSRIVIAFGVVVGYFVLILLCLPLAGALIGFWFGQVWAATALLAWILAGTGCRLVTSPSPGQHGTDVTHHAAVLARCAFTFGTVAIAVRVIVFRPLSVPLPPWIDGAIGLSVFASIFCACAALCFHQCDIARRVPDERIRASLHTTGRAWVATLLFSSASMLLDYVISTYWGSAPNRVLEVAQSVGRGITGLLLLYVVGRTIELHARLGHSLRSKEKIARANWELGNSQLAMAAAHPDASASSNA